MSEPPPHTHTHASPAGEPRGCYLHPRQDLEHGEEQFGEGWHTSSGSGVTPTEHSPAGHCAGGRCRSCRGHPCSRSPCVTLGRQQHVRHTAFLSCRRELRRGGAGPHSWKLPSSHTIPASTKFHYHRGIRNYQLVSSCRSPSSHGLLVPPVINHSLKRSCLFRCLFISFIPLESKPRDVRGLTCKAVKLSGPREIRFQGTLRHPHVCPSQGDWNRREVFTATCFPVFGHLHLPCPYSATPEMVAKSCQWIRQRDSGCSYGFRATL